MMCMFRWSRAVSNQVVVIKGDVLVSEFVTTLSYPFHPEQNHLKDLGEKSVSYSYFHSMDNYGQIT
jgi:hypothetical protein